MGVVSDEGDDAIDTKMDLYSTHSDCMATLDLMAWREEIMGFCGIFYSTLYWIFCLVIILDTMPAF